MTFYAKTFDLNLCFEIIGRDPHYKINPTLVMSRIGSAPTFAICNRKHWRKIKIQKMSHERPRFTMRWYNNNNKNLIRNLINRS